MSRMIGLLFIFLSSSAQATLLNSELVVNGGAETGNTTGWTSTGINAVRGTNEAAGFGGWVFTGGTGPASGQALEQIIDISDLALQVDHDNIESIFSIELQSRKFDFASANISFLDENGDSLRSFGFTGSNNSPYHWSHFDDTRVITSGTRAIKIRLNSTRNTGTSSDGFFDEVSLQVNQLSALPIPIPASSLLLVIGMLGLVSVRKKANH